MGRVSLPRRRSIATTCCRNGPPRAVLPFAATRRAAAREVITDDRHRSVSRSGRRPAGGAGLAARAKAITEREVSSYAERTGRLPPSPSSGHARSCRSVCPPASSSSTPIRSSSRHAAGSRMIRCRRQRVRRLRHGLRRPLRRTRQPRRPAGHRGSARRWHVVRHALRAERHGGRAARRPVPASRCGGSRTRAPRPRWTPSASPRRRPAGTSSSRSRAAITATTTT